METTKQSVTYYVGGVGTTLAMILSWQRNASILWAILHGFCGWVYILFYAVKTGRI